MKKFFKYTILIMTLMITSCSASPKSSEPNAAVNLNMTSQLRNVQEKLIKTEAELNKLKSGIKLDNNSINKQAFPQRSESLVYFPLYTTDVSRSNLYVQSYIAIEYSKTLNEKFQILCSSLSNLFPEVKVELKEIKTEGGKKIAVVNLVDGTKLWIDQFMNKPFIDRTFDILTRNLLQREYALDWVDGVTFIYNGEKFTLPGTESYQAVTYRKN